MRVFEWSTGPSAQKFSPLVKEYHSVIAISSWGSDNTSHLGCTYYIRPVSEDPESKSNYVNSITTTNQLFDIILIRGLEQLQCIQISKKYLAPHGKIIIDNYTAMSQEEKAIILQDYTLQEICNTLGIFIQRRMSRISVSI